MLDVCFQGFFTDGLLKRGHYTWVAGAWWSRGRDWLRILKLPHCLRLKESPICILIYMHSIKAFTPFSGDLHEFFCGSCCHWSFPSGKFFGAGLEISTAAGGINPRVFTVFFSYGSTPSGSDHLDPPGWQNGLAFARLSTRIRWSPNPFRFYFRVCL